MVGKDTSKDPAGRKVAVRSEEFVSLHSGEEFKMEWCGYTLLPPV
jgi:hypothetical protein